MCLLKPGISDTADQSLRQFTFHYVSIKTKIPAPVYFVLYKFTFHHVSIKTRFYAGMRITTRIFTFHHVSIKTDVSSIRITSEMVYSHSTMYLLKLKLPQHLRRVCSYSHSTMYLLKRRSKNILRLLSC